MPFKFVEMRGPSNLHFRVMADGDDELPGGDVVVDAVDHAPAAKRQTHALVIASATCNRVAEFEEPISREYQTMRGCTEHAADHTPKRQDRHINRREPAAARGRKK